MQGGKWNAVALTTVVLLVLQATILFYWRNMGGGEVSEISVILDQYNKEMTDHLSRVIEQAIHDNPVTVVPGLCPTPPPQSTSIPVVSGSCPTPPPGSVCPVCPQCPAQTECPAQPVSPHSPYTAPRIDIIAPTEADNDTSTNWNDDDGKLRIITVAYKPNIDDLQRLRRFVGSIHAFENEQTRITIFGYEVLEDLYLEIRTFAFVRYVNIDKSSANQGDTFAFAFEKSRDMYARFVLVDLAGNVMMRAQGLAKTMNEFSGWGIINFAGAKGNTMGYVKGDGGGGNGGTLKFSDYFEVYSVDPPEEFGRCALQRNLSSPFRSKLLYVNDNDNFIQKENNHYPDDKLICLSIATYSGSKDFNNVDDFSLLKFVMPSFISSTEVDDTPDSRYRFAMYLGVQRDKLYDDPHKMDEIKRKILNATKDRAFSLRIFYTPLNAPALDITYKWNVLIDQSYRDGCDYIYQYSDDTVFSTPWADKFVRYLEMESNFGVAGAVDSNNQIRMTLGFSHRNHITILGSFWPTHLKNWWSDTWAQEVYGPRYTLHTADIMVKNTQNQGQRYPQCSTHDKLYERLMKDESRPKIINWLKAQPQTYDIRQKIDYYENKHAQGAKKRYSV